MLIRPNVIFCSGGGLAPLTPITMQDLKPSMFSPILGESPTFNTGTNYIYLPTHKLLKESLSLKLESLLGLLKGLR